MNVYKIKYLLMEISCNTYVFICGHLGWLCFRDVLQIFVALEITQSKSSGMFQTPSHCIFCKANLSKFEEWTILDNL